MDSLLGIRGQMHHHTKASEQLQKLREEPQTGVKLSHSANGLQKLVFKISVSNGCTGNGKTWGGKSSNRRSTVYYLYGDERRAVRKYIEVNKEFVKSCFNSESYNSPLAYQLPEQLYSLMKEEYEIMEYNGEL